MWPFSKTKKEKKILYNSREILFYYVKCSECGEVFKCTVRKYSELFQTLGQKKSFYEINKEIIGSKCRNIIKVHFELSEGFRPLEYQIENGILLSEEEYRKVKEETDEKKVIQQ